MTLQKQPPVEIPLGVGVDEARGKLFRDPTSSLDVCTNGQHGQAPELRKRRGYAKLPTATDALGNTVDLVLVSLGVESVNGGELVIVGRDHVYGVAAPDGTVDGQALVLRGPSFVGNFAAGIVATTSIGDGA